MSCLQFILVLTFLLLPTFSGLITGSSFVTTANNEYENDTLSCDSNSDCTITCQHERGCYRTRVLCPTTNNLCQLTLSDGSESFNRHFGSNMTVEGGGGDLIIVAFGHRQLQDATIICPNNKLCNITCTAITSASTCVFSTIKGGINGDIILYGSGQFIWFQTMFILPLAQSITGIFDGDSLIRECIFNFTYVKNVTFEIYDLGLYQTNRLQCEDCIIYNTFGDRLSITAEGEAVFLNAQIFGPTNGTVDLHILKHWGFLKTKFYCGSNSILHVKCGDPGEDDVAEYQETCHRGNFFCDEASFVNISVFQNSGLLNTTVFCPENSDKRHGIDIGAGDDEQCFFTTTVSNAMDNVQIYAKNGQLDFKIEDNALEQLLSGGRGNLFCGTSYSMSCIYGYESTYQCITGDNCDSFTHFPTPITTMDPTLVTGIPTMNPSENSITSANPSINPTSNPSINPTLSTGNPSMNPSAIPTFNPSVFPTKNPSNNPSTNPSVNPSLSPSNNPSFNPSMTPSNTPTLVPSLNPSRNPTNSPSNNPSFNPSVHPSDSPSNFPTFHPTSNPSLTPSKYPSNNPIEGSISPTISTNQPTNIPTQFPTINPSKHPTNMPSLNSTGSPTSIPSDEVTGEISETPSSVSPSISNPSFSPSNYPTNSPIITNHPSLSPTNNPILNFPDTPTNNPTKTNAKSNKKSNNSTGTIILATLLPISCVIISIILLYLYYTKYSSQKQRHTKNGLHLTNSNSSPPKNTTNNTKIELKNLSHNRVNSTSNNPQISPILDTANTQQIGEQERATIASNPDNKNSVFLADIPTKKESDDDLYESGEDANETLKETKGNQNEKMKFEDEYETVGNENVKQLSEKNEQNEENETTKDGEIQDTKDTTEDETNKDSGDELYEEENDGNTNEKPTTNDGEINDTQQNDGEING